MAPKTIEEIEIGDTVLMVRTTTGTLEPVKVTKILKRFTRDVHINGTFLDTSEEQMGYASLSHLISQEHQKFAEETGLKVDDCFDLNNPLDNKKADHRVVAVMPSEQEEEQILYYAKPGDKGCLATSTRSMTVKALRDRHMKTKSPKQIKTGDKLETFNLLTGEIEEVEVQRVKMVHENCVFAEVKYSGGRVADTYLSTQAEYNKVAELFFEETGLRPGDRLDADLCETGRDREAYIHAIITHPDGYEVCFRSFTGNHFSYFSQARPIERLKEKHKKMKKYAFNIGSAKLEETIKITERGNGLDPIVQFADGRDEFTRPATLAEIEAAQADFLEKTGLKMGDKVDAVAPGGNKLDHELIAIIPREHGFDICFKQDKDGRGCTYSSGGNFSRRMQEAWKEKKMKPQIYAFNPWTAKVEVPVEVISRGLGLSTNIKFTDGHSTFGHTATQAEMQAAETKFLQSTGFKIGDMIDPMGYPENDANPNHQLVAIIPTGTNTFDICFKTPNGAGVSYYSSGYLFKRLQTFWQKKLAEKLDKTFGSLKNVAFDDEKFLENLSKVYKENVLGGSKEEISKTVKGLTSQLQKMTEQLKKMTGEKTLDKNHEQHPEKAKAVEDFVQAYQDNGNQVSPESVAKLREEFKEFNISAYQEFVIKDVAQDIEIVLTREQYPQFFHATTTAKRLDGFQSVIKSEQMPVPMNAENPNRQVFKRGDKVQLAYIENAYLYNTKNLTFVEKVGAHECRVRNDGNTKISRSPDKNVGVGEEFVIRANSVYHMSDDLVDLHEIADKASEERQKPSRDMLAKFGLELGQTVYWKNLPHTICNTYDLSNERVQLRQIGTDKYFYPFAKEVSKTPPNIMSAAKKAAYRIAAVQVKKLTKQVFMTILQKRMENAALFLDTEYGEALIAILSGIALSRVDHPKAQLLATEFQISGMAQVGNAVADEVLEALVPVFKSMFAAEDGSGSARILSTANAPEESESAAESDLGRSDEATIPLARVGSAG